MKQLQKENSCVKWNMLASGKNEEFSENVNHQNFTKGSRKAVILIVMLLGFSIISSAQLKWGVKLGVNASTQSEIGDICDDNDLKIGFISGIVIRSEMNDWLALKSGIDYQLKGEKCELINKPSEIAETTLMFNFFSFSSLIAPSYKV